MSRSKLSGQEVAKAWQLADAGVSQADICRRLGADSSSISKIVRGVGGKGEYKCCIPRETVFRVLCDYQGLYTADSVDAYTDSVAGRYGVARATIKAIWDTRTAAASGVWWQRKAEIQDAWTAAGAPDWRV